MYFCRFRFLLLFLLCKALLDHWELALYKYCILLLLLLLLLLLSHSSAVRFSYCLANFSRAARCLAVSRGFFCLLSSLQPSLFINLQMVFFPPTWPLLANCCESCLVEFPLFYLALFRILLAASLRIFGLPVLFLSSNPSFLDDYFTTQHSDFFSFLEISLTDKPVDLSIDAWALKYLSCYSQP